MGEPRIDAPTRPLEQGLDSLIALASARPDMAWPQDRDISLARNAHETNTVEELTRALRGDFDWLESDVRVGSGNQPVLRHDVRGPNGMALEPWLRVVKASGRGAKLDVKEAAALPMVLEAVRASGIPQHRIIINVGALPGSALSTIRRALPDAWVNLSPARTVEPTSAELARLQISARIVGGRVMFPIRQDIVTDGVVHALRPFGRVAVWNSPQLTNPDAEDVEQLRAMGVDGMVDLRKPTGGLEQAMAAVVSALRSVFGWGPIHQALDAVGRG